MGLGPGVKVSGFRVQISRLRLCLLQTNMETINMFAGPETVVEPYGDPFNMTSGG